MANAAVTASRDGHFHRFGVLHLTVSGAITAAIVFFFCWLGTFVPFSSPTHGYISVFTNAPISSGQALWQGLCWSLLFGGLFSLAFALIYNLLVGLERR